MSNDYCASCNASPCICDIAQPVALTWQQRMEDMRDNGLCIVALRLGYRGWSCDVTDPDGLGFNLAGFTTPEAAVQAAHEKWQAKHPEMVA